MKYTIGFWSGRLMLSVEFHHSMSGLIGNARTNENLRNPSESRSIWYTEENERIDIKMGDLIIVDEEGRPFNDLKYLIKDV